MNELNFLFWNIKGKNLATDLAKLVYENKTDILAVAESEQLDREYLIKLLKRENLDFTDIIVRDGGDVKIHLFCKKEMEVSIFKKHERYVVYRIISNEEVYLLFVVHFPSARYKSEEERNSLAQKYNEYFTRLEYEVFKDEKSLKSIFCRDNWSVIF